MLLNIRFSSILFTCFFAHATVFTQIVINEASNKNGNTLLDEDGDYESWIELYNAGLSNVNLLNYGISDDSTLPAKWLLPEANLAPGQFILLYASGKNRKPVSEVDHWEQPINDATIWKYVIPNIATPVSWKDPGFNDASWSVGLSSVGYGDDDDASVVPEGTRTVYLRHKFTIEDTALIANGFFSLDYDDGFVAYLNGNVIALNGFDAGSPAFNAFSGIDHEAAMYGGGSPEHFNFDEALLKTWLVEGENILAVEVHNVTAGSSDLTARPFFSFGIKDEAIIWTDVLPAWFPFGAISENLHTNFKISPEGEKIYLSDATGLVLDTLYVYVADADQSVGCITDGADETGIFINSTPNFSNAGAIYDGYIDGVAGFSLDAGFYEGDQTVAITVPLGTIVHYTTNGAVPTIDDAVYTSPVTIDETTVLKARVFDADNILLPGKISTNSYFIDESISVPVISISTNAENLYGGFGIFDNWWTDWKKLSYIEYFDSLHVNAFEQHAALKVDGGAGGSRSQPQKSMRVELDNDAYGDGELEYPIMSRRNWVPSYETFYLRNGSNMYNVLPYKDAFMVRTTEGTYNEHMAYEPIVVFINGEYWGLYELRNKMDEGHFEHAKGIDKDSLDLMALSYWYGLVLRTLSGSDSDFIEMRNVLATYPTPADPEYYALADSMLDLQNFTDYIACQMFFANYDWPYNNIKAWRDRGGDNKWKYGIIDVELGLGIGGWSDANSDLIPGLFNTQQYIEPLATLLQNPIYHDYFVNRYADLMNTVFLPERTLAMEDSIYNSVIPELPRQLEMWGWGSVDEQIETFNNYREALRDDFEVRADKERTHVKNGFGLNDKVEITLQCSPPEAGYIKISTITIFDLPWSGIYFDGVPVQITAYPNTGFTFSNWEASEFIDDVLAPGFLSNIDDDVTFTANFTGTASPSLITISEINYNPEATVNAGNWIELWNFGVADVNISNWKIRDANFLHEYIFPENTWLNADERLVIAVDTTLFFAQHPGLDNVYGPLGFGLNNSEETIQLINLKGEIAKEINYTDESPWPGGADGQGRTMELNNPLTDINLATNWFDGCIGGSPGLPYTPCDDDIIFSEIYYNPGATFESADWIELRNISGDDIDISGWKLMDDSTGIEHEFIIEEGTVVNSGNHLVLAQQTDDFSSVYPDVTNVKGPYNFDLNDNGEWIRMYDANGILVLSVQYDDFTPWPLAADGGNYSLELVDSMGLMNSGLNWQQICPGGSPGAYPSTPCEDEIAIESIETNSVFSISPNPTTKFVVLTSSFENNTDAIIQLIGLDGSIVQNLYQGTLPLGELNKVFDVSAVKAGIYFVRIVTENGNYIQKLVKQ